MMGYPKLLTAATIQLLALSFTLGVQAQGINGSDAPLPGSILQDLQLKTVPGQIRPDTQRQAPPEANVEDTQSQGQPEQQDNQPTQKVLIKDIQVEGITLLDPLDVERIISAYENRESTFEDIQGLTDQLTTLYRDAGYVTSRVYIPPQKLQNGELKLKALEGKMGKLTIKEGRYFKARSVKYGVSVEPGEPFRIDDLQVDLRRLNENPDRNVRAVLKPGEQTGETDVELQIRDQFPFHVGLSFDNLGRRVLGNNRAGLRLTHNNVLGFGDSFLSSLSFTRRSFGLVNRYQVPIGDHGTKVGFDHAYSRLRLGEEFEPLDIVGRASTYSPFIMQDFINTDKYKLYADVAFDMKQMDTDFSGTDLNRDQVRVLRPGINFEEYDRFGRTFMRHELGWGLDVFGATDDDEPTASRAGAGGQFIRYTGSLIRTQIMPWNTFGIFRVIGQLTPDRLVSAEQFQVGGAFTVRGYKEGQITADNGLLVSAEWRAPFFLFPKTWKLPGTDYILRDNVQLVSFLDYGNGFNIRPIAGESRSEHVLGTGLGLRARLTRFLTARVDVGVPLFQQPNNDGPRIHFGLQTDLY